MNLFRLTAIFALLASYSANAALVSIDLVADSGDQLITRHTSTNLEWLDISATTGLSVLDIQHSGVASLGIAPIGQQGGFRYATVDEVEALFAEFGLIAGAYYASDSWQAEWAAVENLQNYLGFVARTPDNWTTIGVTADTYIGTGEDSILYYRTAGVYRDSATELRVRVAAPIGSVDDYSETTWAGHFLVREMAPVPLPGAAWLFGSALMLIRLIRARLHAQ